jgi:hypothetical protein
MTEHPALEIEFIPGGSVIRGAVRDSTLPILRNGPPGTVLAFSSGRAFSLPSDQITQHTTEGGLTRVSFGGMKFEGPSPEGLRFRRIRDLLPEEQLSPERGFQMVLDPSIVTLIFEHGKLVWSSGAVH